MKTRTTTAILLILLTFMSTGTAFALMNNSYACWKPTCIDTYCKVKFTHVEYWDNEIEKNVGHVYAWITDCEYKIEISICNAYPCYTAYINFTIKNEGNLDVHIDEVSIENPPEALETMLNPNLECIWIEPCHTIEGQLAVHILQTAQECHTYTFEITIKYSCGERPHPRTIGFWKDQFYVALYHRGKAQVDPETLEQYLDEITSSSDVFEFDDSREEKFKVAYKILRIEFGSSMEAKLKAHLLALWLNYVADWTEGYTLDGMTAYEIIEGSENALDTGATTEYEDWKILCDDFNNLG
jgi:hypothetical protein